MRVDFGGQQISLQGIQDGISSTIEYEHIPLGKVQGWIRPGMALFEALFSVSVNESPQSKLWDIVESEPPEADVSDIVQISYQRQAHWYPQYPLAVEIVIEPSTDSVTLKAAWMDQGHAESPRSWLCDLEDVVHSLAENTTAYLSHSLEHIPRFSHTPGDSQDDRSSVVDHSNLDPVLISSLRTIISDFMGFNPVILTPLMSLISMGLDSIKSVGLAKSMTKQGFPVTSTDILRHATLNELASCIKSKQSRKDDLPVTTMPVVSQLVLSEFNVDDMKLGKEQVDFFPTTALQTGMLSQVSSPFLPNSFH